MPDAENRHIIISDKHLSAKRSTSPSGSSRRRPATEKRKQQNRVAQQKYREKQKRLLEQLKLRAAWDDDASGPAGSSLLENETSSSHSSPNVAYSSNLLNDATVDGHGTGTHRSIESSGSDSIGAENILDFQLDGPLADLEENISVGSSHAVHNDQVNCTVANDTSQIIELPASDPLYLRDKLQLYSNVCDLESKQVISGVPVDEELTPSQPRMFSNIQALESSQGCTAEATAQVSLIESNGPPTSRFARGDIGSHTFGGMINLANIEDSQNRCIARDTLTDDVNMSLQTYCKPHVPDVHVNSITLTVESTLSAILHNAYMVGLTFDEVLNDDDSMSRFYRPNLTLADDIKSVQESFAKDLMPDLRPTLAQIVYPHHSCYDLIPFPTMRSRIVALLACAPPAIDEDELENDMHNGLICWRTSNRGSGQPWDARSWEVQPWFLKKWSFLLGGEEGEAWRQTVWWRTMRGENGSI
ncbi:hypothetical protein V1509DRAFT_612375 [Lipomyces kononenkoae]